MWVTGKSHILVKKTEDHPTCPTENCFFFSATYWADADEFTLCNLRVAYNDTRGPKIAKLINNNKHK